MKPLTRYDHGLAWNRAGAEPYSSCMVPDDEGEWYAKDEADALVAAKDARIAELEDEVERLDVGGVHSCHQHCKRPACVQRRRIAELEAERDAARADAEEQRLLAHKLGIALDVVSRGPDTSGMTVTHNVMPTAKE